MIAFRGRGRMNGRASFAQAVEYVTREGEDEPALAVWSEGVSSIETAALEMDAVRDQTRSEDALYHVILSFAPGEEPDYERARAALTHVLTRLGIEDHQYVAALQNDGASGMWHVHGIVNLVHPMTLERANMHGDFHTMREAAREFEIADGWRRLPARDEARSAGRDRYGARARFAEYIRREVAPEFAQLVEGGNATWEGVRAWLHDRGITYEVVREYGARLVGQASGWVARVKELGYSHKDLLERLGAWRDGHAQARAEREHAISARLNEVRKEVATLGREATWNDVHALFERRALEYKRSFNGARVVEIESAGHLRIAKDDALSIRALEKRFGPFQSSREAEYREKKRAAVERLEDMLRAARLADDPQPLLDTLFATQSVVSREDIDRTLARDVHDAEYRGKVRAAVEDRLVVLERSDGSTRYTTAAVMAEEDDLREAADELARRRRGRAITRAAGKHLDEQQRRAYAYAADDAESLKVITGVPGSGKTTLINEVAAAYRSVGYNARALSVANSAVDVLRAETGLPSRSVAAELHAWGRGNEVPLSDRDLLIVDEVSTLGTKDGRALLREAVRAGAVVIAFGDDKQFEAVARGSALRVMQQALTPEAGLARTVDMEQTRRQQLDKNDPNERWMRDASEAARSGRVREALTAYRQRGRIQGFRSSEDARMALVMEWARLEGQGVTTSVETYTNRERQELNYLLRTAHRSLGRLEGADRELETMDGRTPYAVGDRVTIRETVRPLGLFNGSACTVVGIDGATLRLRRRDGEIVSLDTRQHRGVQHGYCSTEFREQGATREAELQYFTRQVNQRSVTVGLTRHTSHYGGFYSEQEFRRGFDGLCDLAERSRAKELVRDHREVGRGREAVERTRAPGRVAVKRERERVTHER